MILPGEWPVELAENVPFSSLTTLGVGGPARYLASCRVKEEILACLAWAKSRGIPVFVLGGGSNLLVSDAGFDGLVLRPENDHLENVDEGDWVRIRAGAGTSWDHLVAHCVEKGLGGLECLSGIPGRVGAAPIQNIGAYGQEVGDVIQAVHAVDRETSREVCLSREACGFGYRTSRFKTSSRDRFVVLEVDLRLRKTDRGQVRYAELQKRFGGAPDCTAGLSDIRRAVLEIRRAKSMLYDPEDPNGRSAGSFFLNPVVSSDQMSRIEAELARHSVTGRQLPVFPAPDGQLKLSAAYLIEESGFSRGYVLGQAGLSTRHALAVINRGGARAEDLVALAERIRAAVFARFGVQLKEEPVLLGFDEPGGSEKTGTSRGDVIHES